MIDDPQTQSSYDNIAGPISVAVGSTGATITNQRILPRQISSGALRGTQQVGYGNVKIDGSNNQITVGTVTNTIGEQAETVIGQLNPTNPHDQSFGLKVIDAAGTSVTYGLLSDGSPGMEITDGTGFVLFKLTGKTWYWYDKINGTNIMQVGQLPDGSYGWVTVPPTHNVSEAF